MINFSEKYDNKKFDSFLKQFLPKDFLKKNIELKVDKDNEYFKESIKYYSLALQNLKQDHFLFPKILDRRGTSFERLGEWKKAEKDLLSSLKI